MPNLGPLEIGLLLLALAIPIVIGFWCMRVFRRKGKSPGAGFALGLLLTLFFSLIGAAIAVAISYAQAESALVATFGQSTGWAGKTITYDRQSFIISGIGRVSARDVLTYDAQGHIVWAHDGMRQWVAGMVGEGQSAAV
jgi:ABC-type transport system involved in multi-copper enzyme maturation permease subunit